MKLTTESSACLYSYLPLTSKILLTTLLSQTLNLCSSGDLIHHILHQNKMTGKKSVLYISTCNILNWMAASIAWTYRDHFSKNTALLIFHQDLTCLKSDLQQSDSDTLQPMWHKTQTAPDITIRSVQNPFSTFELLHEYRLPEKLEILNIYSCEQHSRKTDIPNSDSVITWSAIGSWISFSAISLTCDIFSFKTTHLISTMNRCQTRFATRNCLLRFFMGNYHVQRRL